MFCSDVPCNNVARERIYVENYKVIKVKDWNSCCLDSMILGTLFVWQILTCHGTWLGNILCSEYQC